MSRGQPEEAIEYLHKALDGSEVDLLVVKRSSGRLPGFWSDGRSNPTAQRAGYGNLERRQASNADDQKGQRLAEKGEEAEHTIYLPSGSKTIPMTTLLRTSSRTFRPTRQKKPPPGRRRFEGTKD